MKGKSKQFALVAFAVFLSQNCSHATGWAENIKAGEEAYRQGQKSEAERVFKQALKEAGNSSVNNLKAAEALNNLGVIYDETGRYDEAESCYKRALAIREKAYGPNHGAVATTLNNLANLYKDKQKYKDAEPLYKRAIDIYLQVDGLDSESLAMSYFNLGKLYSAQNQWGKSVPLYKRSLETCEKIMGPDNNHTIDVMTALADAYDKLDRTSEAKPLYDRYLASVERILGLSSNDPKTAAKLQEFAQGLRKNNQTGNAELLERAIRYHYSNSMAR